MRKLNLVDVVVRGDIRPWELDLQKSLGDLVEPHFSERGNSRYYLVEGTNSVLEAMRVEKVFAQDTSVYLAPALLMDPNTSGMFEVTDEQGVPVLPFKIRGSDLSKWAKKKMFVVERDGDFQEVTGFRLDLAHPGFIDNFFSLRFRPGSVGCMSRCYLPIK